MEADSKSFSASSRALTIAGFDPSGGAGVLADVRTFREFGLAASAAITSITFQNTNRGFGAIDQTGEAVRQQVLPLLDDFSFVCAKTGMLPTREVVSEVARLFRESDLPRPVVDPVMVASSGQRLMEEVALATLIRELFPVARLVTPNIPEAEALTGISIVSESDMRRAAVAIREMGARAVLIKGGHLPGARASCPPSLRPDEAGKMAPQAGCPLGDPAMPAFPGEAIDVLDNEGTVTIFRQMRVAGPGIRGSGCILSAAIAAGLRNGQTLEGSVRTAKNFVWTAISEASEAG
ncbi:MAG: hydroxymethylpyrimidine/phosphomethylpyrimidine kinase [Pyrinomonadaceae bacterium]|nr:hydroxymethylpyrimidine/phosphomethylpyrimidine kinase [Pyrinomonadaceae bacterium]